LKRLILAAVAIIACGCGAGRGVPSIEKNGGVPAFRSANPETLRRMQYESRLKYELSVSPESVRYICDSFRKKMSGIDIGQQGFVENAPAELKKPYSGWVFVSAYGKKGKSLKAAAKGENAAEASLKAIRKIALQDKKKKLYANDDNLFVKMDFTEEMLSVGRLESARQLIVPGVHGIWLLPESREEYRLPSDMLVFSPADTTDLSIYFSILPEADSARLFRTKAFLQSSEGKEPVKLVRGLPPVPEITPVFLRQRVAAACEYLLRNQRDDGSYKYLYAANRDKDLKVDEESIVRHTAACAVMFMTGEELGRKDFIESGEKSLVRVMEQAHRHNGLVYLTKHGKGALGGSGLLLWAVSRCRSASGKDTYDKIAGEAADFILALRKPDGTFYNFFDPASGKPLDKPALYYQGEACYGLYWHYEAFGGQKYLDAALAAATALSKHILRQFDAGAYPLDAWLMQAVRPLYFLASPEQKKIMLEACVRMADAMVKAVRTEKTAIHPDLAGSFRSSAQELPAGPGTAAMCEGLNEICLLLKEIGEPGGKIMETLLRSTEFQLRHQFWGDNMYFLPNPERAKGGVKGTLLDNKIRIDHVQHSVGSWLGLLKLME